MTTLPDPAIALTSADARTAFAAILDGKVDGEAISNFLVQLADRGETATEIAAAAQEMRARMITVEAPANAIDVCGTGGDGSHSLNISTATALVVAACDIPMAKHGNRAASSKSGAADTLEASGPRSGQSGNRRRAIPCARLASPFSSPPNHHPALGPLAPIRKAIGRRTIFNLLGPLCNPARVKRQLIGVASPDLVETYAEAAAQLGYEKVMIVSGEEGLDELSISGPSRLAIVEGQSITHSRTTPEDIGLSRHDADAIKGGDAEYNAKALRALLQGRTFRLSPMPYC